MPIYLLINIYTHFCFIFEIILYIIFSNKISPFPFLSPNLRLRVSFKFMVLFFLFLTNCYCMHIYMFIYSTKYNLFNLHTATCMCVFRADYLALENQLVCSF